MNGKEDLLNIIKKSKQVLMCSSYNKERYKNDIEWFNNIERDFERDFINVALIGITSSGKSTLVNAILGEKLLPVAIKPSSNIIITCSKGNERKATIYFEDSKPKELIKDDLNEKNIELYADESKNPDNKFKVSQIDICSPTFIFEDNIRIIDSPGLDACGLESHEQLTLEVLLPTIDICIFLTTVKANSDNTILSRIKYVLSKNKKVVLVQNMIDSIVPKIGIGGNVEEDIDEILKKHRIRAKKLVKRATGSIRDINIIQVSALEALRGRIEENDKLYNNSQFDSFIKSVNLCVESMIPKINNMRKMRILNKINEILETDKSNIDGLGDIDLSLIIPIKKSEISKLEENFKNCLNKISEKIKEIEYIRDKSIDDIEKSYDIEESSIIIGKINKANLDIQNNILDIVSSCEEKRKRYYEVLNLDFRNSVLLPSGKKTKVDVKYTYVPRIRYIEKEGLFNKGKRFFADIFNKDWGYDVEEYDEKVVDKEATIKSLKKICKKNITDYVSILNGWEKNYQESIDIFYKELKKREEEYIRKQQQKLEVDSIKNVVNKMINLKSIFNIDQIDEQDEIAITIDENKSKKSKEYKKYLVNSEELNIYKLSNEVISKNYLLVGNYIKNKSEEQLKHNCKKLFWCWDLDNCKDFLFRINGHHLSCEEEKELKKIGCIELNEFILVYECCKNEKSLFDKLNKDINNYYDIYVLFNGIQIGNSQKQILKSINLEQFIKNNFVVLNTVIDSLQEFKNAKNLSEVIDESKNLQKILLNKFNNAYKGYLLINSKNPIYNMVLIECEEKRKILLSDYKSIKNKIIKNILFRSSEDRNQIEEILSYYGR